LRSSGSTSCMSSCHARAHTPWPVLSPHPRAVRAWHGSRPLRVCAWAGGDCRPRLQAGKAEQGGPRGARARRPREQQQRAGEQGGRQRQRRRERGGQAARAQAQQLQRRRARARALQGRAQLLSQGALSGRARQVQALRQRRIERPPVPLTWRNLVKICPPTASRRRHTRSALGSRLCPRGASCQTYMVSHCQRRWAPALNTGVKTLCPRKNHRPGRECAERGALPARGRTGAARPRRRPRRRAPCAQRWSGRHCAGRARPAGRRAARIRARQAGSCRPQASRSHRLTATQQRGGDGRSGQHTKMQWALTVYDQRVCPPHDRASTVL